MSALSIDAAHGAAGPKPTVTLDFSADGYRMPTEAEWAYAAKANTELVYSGSDQLSEVGWFDENSNQETHPVAQKKPNAWGLYDMSGHVDEWCNDQWDDGTYQSRGEITVDPCAYTSSPTWRVSRGGSWRRDADACRVACRDGYNADARWDSLGGRLLRSNLDA